MDNRKAELHDIIEKLIATHEDAGELRYWESIFHELSESEKDTVLENLKKELDALGG